MKKGYIVLENGMIFEGKRFGCEADVTGELVFSTSAVGYIEALTDPCYQGQILLQTFPLTGNYGWITEDADGNSINAAGLVVREWCETPSNFRSDGTIDAEMKRQKIPGICDVDTRELTKILREQGVMNAVICDDPAKVDIAELRNYRSDKSASTFVVDYTEEKSESGEARYNVTVINCGNYKNVVSKLVSMNFSVTVVPCTWQADKILSTNPDGIVISDGPGDPKDNAETVKTVADIMGKVPVFGISLGHQIMALANGADTFKLKYGHRGGNQPVKNLKDGKVYITSQNHGYAVDEKTLPAKAVVTHKNCNDGTVEGLEYPEMKAFSVQFTPEKGFSNANTEDILYGKFAAMLSK